MRMQGSFFLEGAGKKKGDGVAALAGGDIADCLMALIVVVVTASAWDTREGRGGKHWWKCTTLLRGCGLPNFMACVMISALLEWERRC
jgi:hypothetical protein